MQRSSESIACLAAALAKAQAELTNPEKSLVATIRPNGPDLCPAFMLSSRWSGLTISTRPISTPRCRRHRRPRCWLSRRQMARATLVV
jgi:hypothetical protein